MSTTTFGYTFRTTPRQMQIEDLERSWLKPAWARLWEMRVGKGVATAYEMDAMATLRGLTRFLVVCPKRVMDTWAEILQAHTGLPVFLSPPAGAPQHGVYVLNYEKVWTRDKRGSLLVSPWIVDWGPEFVVADEAHLIKNRMAGRSKALHRLGAVAPYRRALTGTPDPRSFADYYSIYRFLDPTVFGTWQCFAEQYLVLDFWKQVVGYKRVDTLAAKVHSLASRALRRDYFDIPEVEAQDVAVTLPAQARRAYKEMAKNLFTEISAAPRETAVASIPLTKLLRLSQIAGGFLTIEEDGQSIRWLHDAKIVALCDVLETTLADAGAQAVVFAKFRAEIARIVEALTKRHLRVLQLHGGTVDTAEVLQKFREKRADVLVSQIATGNLGIDLSTAATCIFFSWDFNAGDYQQARDRIWKAAMGAGDKLTIVHLVGAQTIDETMLRVVQGKLQRSALVLDNWQSIIGGP